MKKIEYFIFGALSAYQNHHFTEAWNFISQSPFICNFGKNVLDIETLLVFEMLKMVEIKLLTKIGRPEQAVITLNNRFFQNKVIDDEEFNRKFPFSAKEQNALLLDRMLFIDHTWCLYKSIKYQCKLIEFKQDHYSFKMLSMISNDQQYDAEMLQKANVELTNQLFHLNFITKALNENKRKNRLAMFEWLLVKILLQLDRQNKTRQMISNDAFDQIYNLINVTESITSLFNENLTKVTKPRNKEIIDDYLAKYNGKRLTKQYVLDQTNEFIQR